MSYKPLVLTASTTLRADTHAGAVSRVVAVAGATITLPASAGTGDVYTIECGATITSNNLIIAVANATDVMEGAVSVASDIAGVTCPTTATSDTITMNGSTKGGVLGSFVVLQDVAAGFWKVSGALVATGTEATPFSAAVS